MMGLWFTYRPNPRLLSMHLTLCLPCYNLLWLKSVCQNAYIVNNIPAILRTANRLTKSGCGFKLLLLLKFMFMEDASEHALYSIPSWRLGALRIL